MKCIKIRKRILSDCRLGWYMLVQAHASRLMLASMQPSIQPNRPERGLYVGPRNVLFCLFVGRKEITAAFWFVYLVIKPESPF